MMTFTSTSSTMNFAFHLVLICSCCCLAFSSVASVGVVGFQFVDGLITICDVTFIIFWAVHSLGNAFLPLTPGYKCPLMIFGLSLY